ncbi:MAG TPA: hypothetical protein VFJ69_08930 [Actinomycetota bacterium]|jgi:hypothetical protein|nr:hypothetical protein [Actinomycetota bacterium]
MTAEQRDRVRSMVVASRRAQGLQDSVPESRFLAELAADVLVEPPDPIRHERVRLDDREDAA